MIDTLRQTLARWLRSLATWIDVPTFVPVPLPASPVLTAFERAVREAVQAAEASFPTGYGEAKRHHAYAALTKQFPGLAKSQIGLEIEKAVAWL